MSFFHANALNHNTTILGVTYRLPHIMGSADYLTHVLSKVLFSKQLTLVNSFFKRNQPQQSYFDIS